MGRVKIPEVLWRRFAELGVTARSEYERLLRAGDRALLHLPQQHRSSIREVLEKHKLTESDAAAAVHLETCVRQECGMTTCDTRWRIRQDVRKMPLEAKGALHLSNLLQLIGQDESRTFLGMSDVERAAIRDLILDIWMKLFVRPEEELRVRREARSRGGKTTVEKVRKENLNRNEKLVKKARELVKSGTATWRTVKAYMIKNNLSAGITSTRQLSNILKKQEVR